MEADLRDDVIRLAEAATVRWHRSSREVVLYDADVKPYTYVTATMVKPMAYEGSARYNRAMLLGGKPEPKRDSRTGLRCVQLSAAEVGLSWLHEDINRLAAGGLRSREALMPADPEVARQEVEDLLADVIEHSNGLEESEKEALIKARRGQGKFRAEVLTVEPACRITGVTNPALLRASHIKPWTQCQTHAERLDKYNGLMLTPNADHAFDSGLITFDASGGLIVSPKLPTLDAERLGVHRVVLTGPFSEAQRSYLAYHRERIFQR